MKKLLSHKKKIIIKKEIFPKTYELLRELKELLKDKENYKW